MNGVKIRDIADMPICWEGRAAHESVLRAYQILEAVKYWLSEGVPGKIVLELVAEMERVENPKKDKPA